MPLYIYFGCIFIMKELNSTLELLGTDGYVNCLQKQIELVHQNICTQLDHLVSKEKLKGTSEQYIGLFSLFPQFLLE